MGVSLSQLLRLAPLLADLDKIHTQVGPLMEDPLRLLAGAVLARAKTAPVSPALLAALERALKGDIDGLSLLANHAAELPDLYEHLAATFAGQRAEAFELPLQHELTAVKCGHCHQVGTLGAWLMPT